MLTSVSDWEKFTDTIGAAFLSKNSRDFQNYLKFFFGDAATFQTYADQVLIHDDVVLAELDPTLFLEGGGQIGIESPLSPFFDTPFGRDCWSADYEHGKCYSSSTPLSSAL